MVLTQHGAVAAPDRSLCTGPLASCMEGFVGYLSRQGYSPDTIRTKCYLFAGLSRWLDRHNLPVAALDEQRLRQFQASGRRRSTGRRGDLATGQQLLEHLRDCGKVAPAAPTIDRHPAAGVLHEFEAYLYSERGLSVSTVISYLPVVRRFLDERFQSKVPHFDQLCSRELHDFILREIQRVSRTHGKAVVTALRSFLRFLLLRGLVQTDLACLLPGVVSWRLSHLPRSLRPKQVEQLLASCDRSSPSGKRDYAILLLLARLGLRGGEVLAMTLEDLDWDCGEIVVRGKGQRLERLPLPADVGAALARYLREVRPPCETRRVFVRMKAPYEEFSRTVAICCVVRRALARAGLNPVFKGAHLLRHSLATNLLRRGASLREIGQLLRHRQPTTTQIYAKVDIASLRTIALPWPGGAS